MTVVDKARLDPKSPWGLTERGALELEREKEKMNAVVTTDQPPLLRGVMAAESVTPSAMISLALQQGIDIQRLEKLMELHERWEAGQARKAFDAAIASAKAEIKPIVKKREVDFPARNGGTRTNYMFEDLAAIADHIDPILAKYGLSYRHRPKQDQKILTITCILSHRDGHSEETSLFAANDESGNKNAIQSIGSTATYLQRYTLKLALGLAAAKDDDGRAAGKPDGPTQNEAAAAPAGYERWKADMTAKADEGYEKFGESWKSADKALRTHALKCDVEWRTALIEKAKAVDAKAAERLR